MSRRDHSAHDLASLRIDLFGETAKTSSTPVFGRKARGTVDKRGNVLATAPFLKRKRHTVEVGSLIQGGSGEPTVPDIKDGALESGRPKKKKRTYYPGVLPYLDISEGAGNAVYHPENEQPTAVSIHLPLRLSIFIHPMLGPTQEDTPVCLRVLLGSGDAIRCFPRNP
jgi:hypothetical protein